MNDRMRCAAMLGNLEPSLASQHHASCSNDGLKQRICRSPNIWTADRPTSTSRLRVFSSNGALTVQAARDMR